MKHRDIKYFGDWAAFHRPISDEAQLVKLDSKQLKKSEDRGFERLRLIINEFREQSGVNEIAISLGVDLEDIGNELEFNLGYREFDAAVEIDPGAITTFKNNGAVWELAVNFPGRVNIRNCIIDRLIVKGNTESLHVSGCWIGRIEFSASDNNIQNLEFKDTIVGRVSLTNRKIVSLEVIGGAVLDLYVPPPGQPNPFLGNVVIDTATYLPVRTDRNLITREADSILFRGPQNYRSLRSHLEQIENNPMASFIRSKELAAERIYDKGLIWLFSFFYMVFGSYGQSAGRPLFCFLSGYIAVSWAIGYFDGASLGLSNEHYSGVWEHLTRNDVVGQYARGFALPIQSLGNPFSWINPRKLLVSNDVVITAILFLHGVFSLGMLFLAGLSIRRRFKISS